MNRRVSSKIFRISLIVSFCAQSILTGLSGENHPSKNIQKTSEHIWSLSDEKPSFSTRNNVRNVLKNDTSSRSTINSSNAEENKDWETGWDVNFDGDENDLQTFFPISSEDEGTCKLNDFCTEELSHQKDTKSTASTSIREPDHFYIFENEKSTKKEPGKTTKPVSQLVEGKKSTFIDINIDQWPSEEIKPRLPADISTATQSRKASVFMQEKEKKQINFEQLEDGSSQEPSAKDTAAQTTSLGKNRVSVAPYIPQQEPQKDQSQNKQVISTQKTAELKPLTSKPKNGLFGPFRSDTASKQDKTQTKQSAESDIRIEKNKSSKSEEIIAQVVEDAFPSPSGTGQLKTPPKTILINFNNVSVIEYIRFISRLTNKNFVFDQADLQFNVTIISEEATTLDNVMTALIQELRIHGLSLIEEGNNLIIHQNREIRGISRVSVEGVPSELTTETELVTQVFRLNTLDPERAKSILRPLLSRDALLETAVETRHIIITDLVTNIKKVDTLLKSIDAPNSGLVIGQYVVRNAFMDNLIELAKQIMVPIAQDQALSFIPHPAAKSIFIVSSPFIVERTISVLQHLDNFQGTTRIYDLDDLRFEAITPPSLPPGLAPEATPPGGLPPEGAITPTPGGLKPPLAVDKPRIDAPTGKWELSPGGNWIFRPGFPSGSQFSPENLPQGNWLLDPKNNWYFAPEGARPPFKRSKDGIPGESPKGRWSLDPQGSWIFQMTPGEDIKPERITRPQVIEEELPVGHIERTKFFIHKLEFRRGEDIVKALQSIAESLQAQGGTNTDLITTILSAQWLEPSNSIIITGTDSSIPKVEELIAEIDRPPRQVMIEMLILETTIDDSLTYGVSWATKSGGGNTATAQAFIGGASPLAGAMASTGITNGLPNTPDASNLANTLGYHLGVIGQRLTHNGTQFASLGALVTAVHTRSEANIVLSPKIITEDNKTAEIFVGINSPFLSNSIANDEGSVITTNVEFRDTGTTLKVTPLIGYGDIITLEIEQEVSRTGGGGITGDITDVNLTPTTSINRTSTTVHVPDKHFVVLSGMIQEQVINNRSQFPCLGGIPVLGAAFSEKGKTNAKRNLMIFIRPEIIDTEEEFLRLTRRQQQIFKQKSRIKKSWKYEVDEALDFMNIKAPCCDECD
jgi:type III secretion protein C